MKTIEEIQTQLDEIQKDLNVIKSQPSQDENKIKTTILVGGLNFALHNLGTDEENPYGKLYSWEDAMEACPKGWRIPTPKEWAQFFKSTTHEWIEDKESVNGMKFTDKINGNSIFLPTMGWGDPNYIPLSYNNAYYWSYLGLGDDFLHTNYMSWYLHFSIEDDDVHPIYLASHSFSLSVRCVQD